MTSPIVIPIQRLLDYGLDPNSVGRDRRGPLHVAAAESFFLICKLLLQHGADPWARDSLGNLPLDEAVRNGSRPVIGLLLASMKEREREGGVAGTCSINRCFRNGSRPVRARRVQAHLWVRRSCSSLCGGWKLLVATAVAAKCKALYLSIVGIAY